MSPPQTKADQKLPAYTVGRSMDAALELEKAVAAVAKGWLLNGDEDKETRMQKLRKDEICQLLCRAMDDLRELTIIQNWDIKGLRERWNGNYGTEWAANAHRAMKWFDCQARRRLSTVWATEHDESYWIKKMEELDEVRRCLNHAAAVHSQVHQQIYTAVSLDKVRELSRAMRAQACYKLLDGQWKNEIGSIMEETIVDLASAGLKEGGTSSDPRRLDAQRERKLMRAKDVMWWQQKFLSRGIFFIINETTMNGLKKALDIDPLNTLRGKWVQELLRSLEASNPWRDTSSYVRVATELCPSNMTQGKSEWEVQLYIVMLLESIKECSGEAVISKNDAEAFLKRVGIAEEKARSLVEICEAGDEKWETILRCLKNLKSEFEWRNVWEGRRQHKVAFPYKQREEGEQLGVDATPNKKEVLLAAKRLEQNAEVLHPYVDMLLPADDGNTWWEMGSRFFRIFTAEEEEMYRNQALAARELLNRVKSIAQRLHEYGGILESESTGMELKLAFERLKDSIKECRFGKDGELNLYDCVRRAESREYLGRHDLAMPSIIQALADTFAELCHKYIEHPPQPQPEVRRPSGWRGEVMSMVPGSWL